MMALRKLKQATNINQREKHLVNGFIRLGYQYDIPVIINYICLLYYLVQDKFDKHGRFLKVSSKGDIVEQISNCSFLTVYHTVYGKVAVNIKTFKNRTASWEFKIKDRFIAIGIDSSNYEKTEEFCFGYTNKSNNYGWYGGDGHLYSNSSFKSCEAMQNGDIIRMELNGNKRTLKFYKNDKDINLQFNNVDISKTYRLAISIYNSTNAVQMIDSEFI